MQTHFMFDNFFPENRAVYEIIWKDVVLQTGLTAHEPCSVENEG